MKKIVRMVWIGALSGLAFLIACCSSSRGLTKEEKQRLTNERDSIKNVLKTHWMATPEDNPVAKAEYDAETERLQYQIDSINYCLGKNVDLDKSRERLEQSKQRSTIQYRISQLKEALHFRETACIYGSPEVMKEYGKETQRMRQELKDLEIQLEEMDNKKK